MRNVLNPLFFPKSIELNKLKSITEREDLFYVNHGSVHKKDSKFFKNDNIFESFFELTKYQIIYFKIECLDNNSKSKIIWLKYYKSLSFLEESKFEYTVE